MVSHWIDSRENLEDGTKPPRGMESLFALRTTDHVTKEA